jgi:hypothetical protein
MAAVETKTKKPRLDTFIKLYQELTKVTFTEKQVAQIKKLVLNKCADIYLLNSQEIADLVHACVKKFIRPKKHVRFAPIGAAEIAPELFSEADNDIIFKKSLSELMGIKSSITPVIIPGTTIKGDYYIEVGPKGYRVGYVKINGQIDKARITTDSTGKILSIEEFDMGKHLSARIFYPSGSIKMHTYLNAADNSIIEICYYPISQIKSLTIFKQINGYYLNEYIHQEFDETGKEIKTVTP